MKRERPSRVTITLPPSRLRASLSSWRLCSRSLSESPWCSSSSSTSTRHSSRLRGGSSQFAIGATLFAVGGAGLDLEQLTRRAEVDDRGGADLTPRTPGLVDVTADRELRTLLLDRPQDRLAAEVVAGA